MPIEQDRKQLTHPACEAAAATDPGRVRSGNEDAFGMSLKDGVFLVCDGMGGAAAGEVASDLTVSAMLASFAGWSNHEDSRSSPAVTLRNAITQANRTLYCKAAKDSRLHGMGTTLVALALVGNSAWVAHVGDSRCYIWRDGVLKQCTLDHSLVDEQVRIGSITAEEAERSPLRNVITRAVGSQKSISPDVAELSIVPGDIFLLCSDGLTRELDSRQIGEILKAENNLQTVCTRLIERANQSGGRDNITCLLVRVGETVPDPRQS
jgi:serine/threonine protein phosphatase PrpC